MSCNASPRDSRARATIFASATVARPAASIAGFIMGERPYAGFSTTLKSMGPVGVKCHQTVSRPGIWK